MADGKPTLHHMNHSQSQRILWLLEELQIPYNLELHYRQESGPRKHTAPPELKTIHPRGKAPQLVTAEGRVIIESSAIAKYLIEKYDTGGRFRGGDDGRDGGQNNHDSIRDESLTSFAGASIGPMMVLQIFLDVLTKQTPFFLRPLVALLTGALTRAVTAPELRNMFGILEEELGEQEYFMGGTNPGRADFILEFPVEMSVRRGNLKLEEYPRLKRWRERYQARPAWKEALKKGNGYDLSVF